MVQALTSEQVNQMVQNTMLVLLVRPDLTEEWHTNLANLLTQAKEANLDDEMMFVAALLTLLHSPDDDLPTGTVYDSAWRAIRMGLQTGIPQAAEADSEAMSLERLLKSVVEAVVAVLTRSQENHDVVLAELRSIRQAAEDAEVGDLCRWLDDILALLNGVPVQQLGGGAEGVYAEYWQALVAKLPPSRV